MRLRLLLVVSLFSLAGCHEQLMPTPNLYRDSNANPWTGLPADRRGTDVRVIYATDRAVLTKSPLAYDFDRSPSLAYGLCTVTLGAGLGFDELCKQSLLSFRTKSVPIALGEIREIGRYPDTPWFKRNGERWNWVPENETADGENDAKLHALIGDALARSSSKTAFIYVHGFNNSFENAASVTAQLWHYCGREGVPIVYTWPAGSGLNLIGYNRDRESGEFTAFHLKRFIEAVASTPGLERLDILAHSRGADVVLTALRELHIKHTAASGGDVSATQRDLKLGNVILAAPDIDLDVAKQRLAAERVDLACRRLTIYTSPDDLAIAFSKWLFGSLIRVGTLTLYTPSPEDPTLADVPNIDLIDARVTSDFVGHAYFYSNPAASSDVIMLLRYNRGPGEVNGRPLVHEKNRFWLLTDDYTPSPH